MLDALSHAPFSFDIPREATENDLPGFLRAGEGLAAYIPASRRGRKHAEDCQHSA